MRKRAGRISPDLDQRLQQSAQDRGYRTPSAFIRAAIEDELKSHSQLAGMEEQTAASFDRLSKELRRVLRGQQALFALVDAFAKAFLTCIPEPPMEARAHSIALARDRYTRRAMREYAAKRGWEIAVQIKEVGSGAVERELRERLMAAARRREIDVVLVWKIDRWGRSLADLVVTLKELRNSA